MSTARQRDYQWERVEAAAAKVGLRHTLSTVGSFKRHHRRHPTGACVWPSEVTIADSTGVTERTVRRHVTDLDTVGLVVVYRSRPTQRQNGTYTRSTNRYRPASPADLVRLVQHGTTVRAYRTPPPCKALEVPQNASADAAAVPSDCGLPPPKPDDPPPALVLPLLVPTRPPHACCYCDLCRPCLDSMVAGWTPDAV